MPRLLLVDDNPSIHRIAESLLAPTAVELVCVDSAAEALERFQNGEHFDVAMIDTAMPGMDGWTLLERLRALEATARMPIAMMAGVLDPVDPVKIQNAPIQGFLKKPIELRELGDRVNTLLATPVAAAGPVAPVDLGPTATRPMSHADLAQVVEEFPEFRPTVQLPEDDLLVLGPEDLWMEPEAPAAEVPAFEAPVAAAAPVPALPDLELEELDLDAFQDLHTPEPGPAPEAPAPVEELVELEAAPVPENAPTLDAPSLPELDTLGAEELSGLLGEDLPELPTPQPDPFHSMAPDSEPVRLGAPEPEPEPAWGFPEVVAPLTPAWEAPAAVAPSPEPEPEPTPEPVPTPTPAAATTPAAAPSDAAALVKAILANPEALDALAQALAGRLSEKALREVAWEVIPDLAKKLHS